MKKIKISKNSKRIIVLTFLIFSILQIYMKDFFITYRVKTDNPEPVMFYLPSAKFMKPLVLSYKDLAADIIWIKVIGYFADQFLSGNNFKYLEKLLYIVADLDPMFEKAYLWGGSVLMYNGMWITKERVDRSTEFLKYGWDKIKNQKYPYTHTWDYWRIPHMIGFNYAIELKDVEKGIPYIEELAKMPEAPSFYRTWLSTLYRRSGKKDKAAKVLELELIAENLRATLAQDIDEGLKDQITGRLIRIYRQIYSEQDVEARIKEIKDQINKLRRLYLENLPFVSAEMFFIIGADRALNEDSRNLIDMIYYDEIY